MRNKNSTSQMRAWFEDLDRDGSGIISSYEYFMWSVQAAARISGAGLAQVFARYDRDSSGFLTELEFVRAAREMGVGDHADEIFHCLPGSEQGSVSCALGPSRTRLALA